MSSAVPVEPIVSSLVSRSSNVRDAGGVPGDADADLVVGAADPGELGGVVLRALVAEQRLERDAAAGGAERGAVARRGLVEPVGEPQPAGALHVLGHHRRVARDVLAQVAGEKPRIEVVAAARAVGDVEVDRLAPVEFGRASGRSRSMTGKHRRSVAAVSARNSDACAIRVACSTIGPMGACPARFREPAVARDRQPSNRARERAGATLRAPAQSRYDQTGSPVSSVRGGPVRPRRPAQEDIGNDRT